MARNQSLAALRRFGFLTLDNYSMIAVSNAIEGLRMANRLGQGEAYAWDILSLDGEAARASNGLCLHPTLRATGQRYDIIFVCGGVNVRAATSEALRSFLRTQARAGVMLGALCTGTFALAEAGLLRGYRCAVHWENLSAIQEEFPEVDVSGDMFVIDRNRLTCTGGSVPLDLILKIVEARSGASLSRAVAAQFILDRGRAGEESQPAANLAGMPLALRKAVRMIETQMDRPLRVATLAKELGFSTRHLERIFRSHTNTTPAGYLSAARLEKARRLLQQTCLPVTDVAMACGFTSSAHFSTAYRGRYGYPPRDERRQMGQSGQP
jgi:transcriptional regulator GlxA family with amidase domain